MAAGPSRKWGALALLSLVRTRDVSPVLKQLKFPLRIGQKFAIVSDQVVGQVDDLLCRKNNRCQFSFGASKRKQTSISLTLCPRAGPAPSTLEHGPSVGGSGSGCRGCRSPLLQGRRQGRRGGRRQVHPMASAARRRQWLRG